MNIPLPQNRTMRVCDELEVITVSEPGMLVASVLDTYSPTDGEGWNECKVRAGIEIQQKYGVIE